MLTEISAAPTASLYKSAAHSSEFVSTYVFSTPESRAICNDPLVCGVEYTDKLTNACAKAFQVLEHQNIVKYQENNAVILNILRGGLNFGLRQAIASALNFNRHSSIFISAQRQQMQDYSWIITEDSYKKIDLRSSNQLIFGDVVATGTSLYHGLDVVFRYAADNQCRITDVTFFTIGGPRTIEICRDLHKKYYAVLGIEKINIIFLEGIFAVADKNTPYKIKLEGTDLIRLGAIMAPEFVKSQYENPLFPIERCTIYDAGSRAYNIREYAEDVIDYWNKVAEISRDMTFSDYARERIGDSFVVNDLNFKELCSEHLSSLHKLI